MPNVPQLTLPSEIESEEKNVATLIAPAWMTKENPTHPRMFEPACPE